MHENRLLMGDNKAKVGLSFSQSRCPTFNLNYMLCEYLQMFSDKINKCESQIFTNVRILLFKKFFIGHSSFYKL